MLLVLSALVVSACMAAPAEPTPTSRTFIITPSALAVTASSTPKDTPRVSSTPSPTSPTSTPEPSGPEFRPGINPLTGLPIDSELLNEAPFLVAITNFPPSSRPQAGLSLADHVWESSIAQGQTRFLAVYYGLNWAEYAKTADQIDLPYNHLIGPVRSGRVAFEDIRSFYPDALLITRAASPEILPELNRQLTLYNKDDRDVNSAGLTYQEIAQLVREPASPAEYAGLRFDGQPPANGVPAEDLTIIYNRFAQYGWRYNPEAQRYTRLQAPFDGEGPMEPLADRLTGQPLQFDNVVPSISSKTWLPPSWKSSCVTSPTVTAWRCVMAKCTTSVGHPGATNFDC